MKISNDFEKIAKKSKRKNRLKTVLISTLAALLSLLLIVRGLTKLASYNGNKVSQHYLLMSEIAYPNISYNDWYFTATSSFSGQFQSNRFKNIDGIEVPYEDMKANYSLRLHDLGDSNVWLTTSTDGKSSYTHGNYYKSPMFFNVNHKVSKDDFYKTTKDIKLAAQMPNQAVEMAITFDKPYTYEEIQKLIPKNLTINWYWIGSQSDFNTAGLTSDTQLGISVYDGQALTSNDFARFRDNLRKAINQSYLKSTYGYTKNNKEESSFSLQKDATTYLAKNKNFKSAKFSGLILTGRSENFAQLENASWIYASNLGQSVQIQPYHKLDK